MINARDRSTALRRATTVLIFGISPLAVSADRAPEKVVTPHEEFSAMQHEVNLETGERVLLAHRHKVASYRLCVDSFKDSVPLKVIVDGTDSEIAIDACGTVTGKHIEVEPGAKLPDGEYLVMRFRQADVKAERDILKKP